MDNALGRRQVLSPTLSGRIRRETLDGVEWVEVGGRLRAAVALGLAMGGGGCEPVVETEVGETDGTSGSSSTSSGTSSGSVTSTTTTTVTATSTSGNPTSPGTTGQSDGPRFDLGDGLFDLNPAFDLGGPAHDCEPVPRAPACEAEISGGEFLHPICVETIGDTTCDMLLDEDFFNETLGCTNCNGNPERLACERFTLDDATCCSWVVIRPGQSCPGRPFLVEGHARIPAVVRRDDWSRPCSPNVQGLSSATRAILSQAWAAEGCHEAASVASFSRFVLQLMSLGAPSSIIAKAQGAMADEVEHARAFFGLARAYGGVSVGPGPLSIDGALQHASDPVTSAVSLATEGCIAETVSAMQLELAASRATDPEVAGLLSAIAEQELRHAELAWSALAWMLQRGDDSLRAAVADAFSRAQDAVPRAVSISDELDPKLLNAGGRLTAAQRLDVAQRALASCVAPAAATLLQPWTMTAASPSEVMTPRPAALARA